MSQSPPKKYRKTVNGKTASQENSNGHDHEMATNGAEEIDESLYSRQLYVLGADAMKKMSMSSVLIAGLGPCGVEAAKNIILGGVKKVTLWDNQKASWFDMGAHYYMKEADVTSSRNRAACSFEQLKELNPYVSVELSDSAELTEAMISEHNVLLLSDTLNIVGQDEEKLLALGDLCRACNTSIILAEAAGLAGRVFCDFGASHTVVDKDGAEPKQVLISSVVRDGDSFTVSCHDEVRHELETGEYVSFTEIQGLDGLLNRDFEIRVTGPFGFTIPANGITGDKSTNTGWLHQVKKPITISFNTLRQEMTAPSDFVLTDFGKFERPATYHACFRALAKFQATANDLPKPHDEADATKFMNLVNEINGSELQGAEKEAAKKFSFTARAKLQPVASAIGAIAAQEAVKAVSGKFSPIKQWWYVCLQECLPVNPITDAKIADNRYASQIAAFGQGFQDKMLKQKWFLVGSGAIGCELLKNFAMMGLGNLIITDMDTIERSNLNRQFLFRSWDVGKHKASAAAEVVMRMNPDMKVEAQNNRVGEDSQDVYNDEFMESLDGVANALDNVDARLYMDRRCVYYSKPLLESGTLGTMGNTQIVIPNVTESYGSSRDPPEKSIPICTLKNFPNAIEHCLQWARDNFEGLFTGQAGSAKQYLSDPADFAAKTEKLPGNEPLTTAQGVVDFLVDQKPNDFNDCIEWARERFEENYSTTILQLLHNFPPDQKTSTGAPFWSGPKRCPKALKFDPADETHRDYVVAAAYLRAENYSITPTKMSNEELAKFAAEVKVAEFKPKSVKIATTDAEAKAEAEAGGGFDSDHLSQMFAKLPSDISKVAEMNSKIVPADFEKDDDSNRHIDFIVACSNLRAANYGIEPADRSKSKRIAGRIIPAIATTTALVAGLISAELYKIVNGIDDIEKYRNTFMNLAIPAFSFSEPMAPPKNTYLGDNHWTLWDRFDIDGRKQDGSEMTIGELLDHFKNDRKLEVQMLSSGVTLLYSFFLNPPKKKQDRLAMTVSEAVKTVGKREIADHERYLVLDVCCNDLTEAEEDQDVPYVRYRFR